MKLWIAITIFMATTGVYATWVDTDCVVTSAEVDPYFDYLRECKCQPISQHEPSCVDAEATLVADGYDPNECNKHTPASCPPFVYCGGPGDCCEHDEDGECINDVDRTYCVINHQTWYMSYVMGYYTQLNEDVISFTLQEDHRGRSGDAYNAIDLPLNVTIPCQYDTNDSNNVRFTSESSSTCTHPISLPLIVLVVCAAFVVL